MPSDTPNPLAKPLPWSFIRDLKIAFSGEAQKDSVRAARLPNYWFLGTFLECPPDSLPADLVAECLADEKNGKERMEHELELMELRQRLYNRFCRIHARRAKQARQLGHVR